METKKFAEENAGKFFMHFGERCRLVGIEDSPNEPCLVIEKKNGWLAKPDGFVQMWDGKIERAWYVTKDELIPIEDVSVRSLKEIPLC